MRADDLNQVVAIECLTSAFPWSAEQFEQVVHQQRDQTFVIVAASRVVGFAVVASVLDQAELHSIAIHPEQQGRGLGARLLRHIIRRLSADILHFHLEVRVSNFRAICLYKQCGFTETGRRRNYYRTEFAREDALLMQRSIPGIAENL